jgi:hypothetical protein
MPRTSRRLQAAPAGVIVGTLVRCRSARFRLGAALATAAVALAAAPSALAVDPGRWRFTGFSRIPIEYFQGITHDPQRNVYFDGVFRGLYRTDFDLKEEARNPDAIPADVSAREGYNHIGDFSWDRREGGRVLLPLECYYPPAGNTCGTGSIGVADPSSLRWRYYVKLDPAFIPKAMWNEVSPNGRLLWTSAGDDLLAYRVSEIRPQNAAPAGPQLRPVRRLRGAVPPSGITGAVFHRARLFVAGQDAGPFQVWSINLRTGGSRLEIERPWFGESEGLDVFRAVDGLLHWVVQPVDPAGRTPTFGPEGGALTNWMPGGGKPSRPSVSPQRRERRR